MNRRAQRKRAQAFGRQWADVLRKLLPDKTDQQRLSILQLFQAEHYEKAIEVTEPHVLYGTKVVEYFTLPGDERVELLQTFEQIREPCPACLAFMGHMIDLMQQQELAELLRQDPYIDISKLAAERPDLLAAGVRAEMNRVQREHPEIDVAKLVAERSAGHAQGEPQARLVDDHAALWSVGEPPGYAVLVSSRGEVACLTERSAECVHVQMVKDGSMSQADVLRVGYVPVWQVDKELVVRGPKGYGCSCPEVRGCAHIHAVEAIAGVSD